MFADQIAFKLCQLPLQLAQYSIIEQDLTPEASSVLFSGPKFLVALLAGILMAFAFQILLTNFSVAVGASLLGSDSDDEDNGAETIGGQVRQTQAKIGIWALITGSIALFAASYLAVKLSLIESPLLGVIIGVVIWAAYFSVIVWLGSSAVGSLIGSLVNTATSGLQGLMGTATTAIGANVAKNQAVSTAEEIAAVVRQELTSGFSPDKLKKSLESSLNSLQIPELNFSEIRSQLEKLIGDVDLEALGDRDLLQNIDRETLVELVGNNTNLSKKDLNRLVDSLSEVWQNKLKGENPTEKIINLIEETNPNDLSTEKLGAKIQELVTAGVSSNGKQSNGVVKEAIQTGIGRAIPAVMEKVNLSEADIDKITHQLQRLQGKAENIDVAKITNQLQQFKDQATAKVQENLPGLSANTIQTDIDDYVLNAVPWQFGHRNLLDEFKEVLYDANANPGSVSQQLQQLNKDYFVYLLKRRGDLSPSRIGNIAKEMEQIRTEVLETVQNADSEGKNQDLREQITNYLRSTGKEELNPDAIAQDFSRLLEDPEAGLEDLEKRFSQFDRETLVQLLQQRDDLNEEEANNIVGQLESTRDNVLNKARDVQEQGKAKAQELKQRVEEYLRNTQKEELNPDAIEQELRTLFEDPQAGFQALRQRLSQFDRDTLVQLLSQRDDLSEEQINSILDRAEKVKNSVLQAPKQVTEQAKATYQETLDSLGEYLRNTNLEELDPEGIKQDLTKLLENPQEGVAAIGDRLSQVDRETLVKLLAQREDLSEEQVNQAIDRVQEGIQQIVRAPQRLAKRANKGVANFQTNLENYLRNTDKEELNPDEIKRDVQLLLQDPRSGIDSLGDRFSQFDRETLVSLLSQREDISEEEAQQIVDRIVSVRDSIKEQFEQVQQKMQSILDSSFGKVREYLNSLERPELNYESIQQDFSQLFDDPKAGFAALRDRLSQFDRNTLVAVLSSREDISEEQANQIADRIEETRNNVLQQAERIQQETEKRLNAIKAEAKKQAKDAKKAVTDAAWWLFSASFSSLVASAIAGFVAVNY